MCPWLAPRVSQAAVRCPVNAGITGDLSLPWLLFQGCSPRAAQQIIKMLSVLTAASQWQQANAVRVSHHMAKSKQSPFFLESTKKAAADM